MVAATVLLRPRTKEVSIEPREAAEAVPPLMKLESPRSAASALVLDSVSVERLQESAGTSAASLAAAHPEWSLHLVNAFASRDAIAALGHDPEQTLLSWIFSSAPDVDSRRMIENQLALALADAGGEEDFEAAIAGYPERFRETARLRRARLSP